jgi:1-deoxy-D-xylulose-5-phosphate reductoisomerase
MESVYKKTIAILGSTGSIGTQTLEVIDKFKDKFDVVALACNSNSALLKQQGQKYGCKNLFCATEDDFEHFFDSLDDKIDIVVSALSGFDGVFYSMKFLEKARLMAIANKETIIIFHEEFFKKAKENDVKITPIDSENGVIYQMFNWCGAQNIKEIVITASGGPFFRKDIDKSKIKFSDALKHPNWKMGKKITIDSATMVNKGIEYLEAKRFFNFDKVSAIIQPQSVIHGFVKLVDNSMLSLLSKPNMQIHIANAIMDTKDATNVVDELDLIALKQLEFAEIDKTKFPLFYLAKDIADKKNSKTIVFNAVDEACIDLFERDKISFSQLEDIIINETEKALDVDLSNLLDVIDLHKQTYKLIQSKYDI